MIPAKIRSIVRPVREFIDSLVTSGPFLRYLASALDRRPDTLHAIRAFDASRYVLFRRHYYLAIPDARDLACISDSGMVGINIDTSACFAFQEKHVAAFSEEFRECAIRSAASAGKNGYHLLNGSFMAVDGNMYYGLIRSLAPKRIIEIGSGNSTRLACHAIERNLLERRTSTELICIEPFHSGQLTSLRQVTKVIESYVQDVELALFEELGPGDILFIDSTHTVRPGGDVWWEICEILPRLKPGVYVHFHDISLPKPYPKSYLQNDWYWMEQYFLQAFLAFNERFKIVWPGNYLMINHCERMKMIFEPEYSMMRSEFPFSEPASFWLQVC